MDEKGYLRVIDRIKDVINRGGFKIYASEVENVLLEHPAVVEVAVVAKPCPVLGERVHAFVVLRDLSKRPSFSAIAPIFSPTTRSRRRSAVSKGCCLATPMARFSSGACARSLWREAQFPPQSCVCDDCVSLYARAPP